MASPNKAMEPTQKTRGLRNDFFEGIDRRTLYRMAERFGLKEQSRLEAVLPTRFEFKL